MSLSPCADTRAHTLNVIYLYSKMHFIRTHTPSTAAVWWKRTAAEPNTTCPIECK